MKSEKEWIEDLRKRMEDCSEPLPEGLWGRLSGELEGPATSKVVPMWRRWQVAAAMLILVASSLTYWFWSVPQADFRRQELAGQVEVTPLPEKLPYRKQLAEAIQKAVSSGKPVPQVARIPAEVPSPQMTEEEEPDRLVCAAADTRPKPADRPAGGQETRVQTDGRMTLAEERRRKDFREADRRRMERNAVALKGKPGKSSGISVGISAGNMPYGSQNTYGGMGSFVTRSAYYTMPGPNQASMSNGRLAYSQVLLENAVRNPQTHVKHHMPVTVGLTAAWHFHEDWAVETGLSYTLLSSEIRSGSQAYAEETQTLHYVGIPLKLNRSIWTSRWFSVYASAGGMVEKCVSGKLETRTVTSMGNRMLETTSLEADPLQWSVAAAAGVQVNFSSRLGLYVEPGIAYYFDDHSGVETIRKEHPLHFNLQLGLRFNVTR